MKISNQTYIDKSTRWYVLHTGRFVKRTSLELEREAARRRMMNLPEWTYFAPMLVEESKRNAKTVQKPMCLNYVFVRSTVCEIQMFRQTHPEYNLIRKKATERHRPEYLSVTDRDMQMFMIVAKAYRNGVPCYTAADMKRLNKGDRVRIIGGEFSGVEGILLTRKGKDGGYVVINVCNRIAVPTLCIRSKYIKVVAFSEDNDHLYKKMFGYYPKIRRAMRNHNGGRGIDDADRRSVSAFLSRYGEINVASDKMRGKYMAFVMMSHKVAGNEAECRYYMRECLASLPSVTNPTTRALIYTALFACTLNALYLNKAEELASSWDTLRLTKKQKDIIEDLLLYRQPGKRWESERV